MPENLMGGLQQELTRCRELLKLYESIGPGGVFASVMLKLEIEKAEKSISDNDVIEMLRCYKELASCE